MDQSVERFTCRAKLQIFNIDLNQKMKNVDMLAMTM